MDSRIITKKLEILNGLAIDSSTPITGWQCREAAFIETGVYDWLNDWHPLELPGVYAPQRTVFAKATVSLAKDTPLADTYFAFGFKDLEGMLRIDGKTVCGIDWAHPRTRVPKTGTMELHLEFNSIPGAYYFPERFHFEHGEFRTAAIITVDRTIEALWYDLSFGQETVDVITDVRRKKLLMNAIEDAMLALDLTAPREQLKADAADILQHYRQQVAAIAPDPEGGSLYAVGHTHIDTAWLWPLKETIRKCGRSFSTACRLMEQYPDYHFSCSQAQLYDYTREHFPEVYEDIKKHVAGGRWETCGAMWVEPDCNVPNGESLIRQCLYGIRFYQKEFGKRPIVCWLPDVFGYPASLPEILASCGIKYFSTNKLHWQARDPYPDHLFYWKGLDGTKLLSHIAKLPSFYNGSPDPGQMYKAWQDFEQKAEHPELLFPFGHGDGGGGVTERMMERYHRAHSHYPGLPAMRIGTVEQFFRETEEKAPELPVWDGELYLQTHRGTYTTHNDVKAANRRNEQRLHEAEAIGVIASSVNADYHLPSLEKAWKTLLLNQFHDILPGSSITEVYERSRADHQAIARDVDAVIQDAMRATFGNHAAAVAEGGHAIRIFNPLNSCVYDPLWLAAPSFAKPGDLFSLTPLSTDKDYSGIALHTSFRKPLAQIMQLPDGTMVMVACGFELPPVGYADFELQREASQQISEPVNLQLLENDYLRLELNDKGDIVRIYDKQEDREATIPGQFAGELQLFQDGPEREDAWNLHDTATRRRYAFDDSRTTVQLLDQGPVCNRIRVTRYYRNSTFIQDIALCAETRRLDFFMHVDWQERNVLLKFAVPTTIRSTRATYEIQCGALERTTHNNTGWDTQKFEVPGQRWAMLSEHNYSMALINDANYGYDIKENVMRLSLLRGPIMPDPMADIGKHSFHCAICPAYPEWQHGLIVQYANEINTNFRFCEFSPDKIQPSHLAFMATDQYSDLALQAIKPAEDGQGIIIRFYETLGGSGKSTVRFNRALQSVCECNSLEEPLETIQHDSHSFVFTTTPFQIHSFRVVLA